MYRNNLTTLTTSLLRFTPHPLVRGAHRQTLAGFFLPGPKNLPHNRLHLVEVSGNDRLAVLENYPHSYAEPPAMVLLMHGLGGHADSGYMLRLGRRFLDRDWVVFRMNHRGSGAGRGLAMNIYHSGSSDDAGAALQKVAALYPRLPLVAVGFSLSGNVLLKLLGETPSALPANFCGAIAVNPPIDLSRCAAAISRPGNRVYDFRFVRLLRTAFRQRREDFPSFPAFDFPAGLTLRGFDELCTAPLGGYDSAEDYYAKCSARQFLPEITSPAVLLASDDDPFVPSEIFLRLPDNLHLELKITAGGGHMGFISKLATPLGDHRWLDYAVSQIAAKMLENA